MGYKWTLSHVDLSRSMQSKVKIQKLHKIYARIHTYIFDTDTNIYIKLQNHGIKSKNRENYENAFSFLFFSFVSPTHNLDKFRDSTVYN